MLELWRKRINVKCFSLSHEDPSVFVQSQWQHQSEPNAYYMAYRLVITVYLVTVCLLSIIDEQNLGQPILFHVKWVIYLTNWGFTCCTFQAVICTGMLFYRYSYLKKLKGGIATDDTLVDISGLRFYKLYWYSFTVSLDVSIAITVLYWAVIFQPDTTPVDYLNILVHCTNSIVMLLELCITGHPIRLGHFYIGTTPGVAFTIFSFIYYLAGGTSRDNDPTIYPVIDWRKPLPTLAICFGALVLILVIHCVTYLLFRLRESLANRIKRSDACGSPPMTFRGFDNDCLPNDSV